MCLGIKINIFKDKTHLKLMERSELLDLIDIDYPDMPEITDETILKAQRMSNQGYRSSVRIAMGRVLTSRQYEEKREQILSSIIP